MVRLQEIIERSLQAVITVISGFDRQTMLVSHSALYRTSLVCEPFYTKGYLTVGSTVITAIALRKSSTSACGRVLWQEND